MLEQLRKMSPSGKKKLVGFCAGILTLVIFGAWALHSFGLFSSAYESASVQGVALFSFVEQNVQDAYDAFQKNVPSMTSSSTMVTAEESASTTDIIASTTTSN